MKIKKISIFLIFGILTIIITPNSIALIGTNIKELDRSTLDIFDIKEYRAILIGIKDYPGDSNDLPYSINEILKFKETLLNGGNWDNQNIKILIDSQATKANIYDAIDWMRLNSDINDVSIIYYAGHGGKTNTNEYLITYNSSISDVELDEELNDVKGELVLIIDSCYSGGFIEELGQRGRTILTACKKDELTYQVRDLNSGIFGYFLNVSLEKITKSAENTFLLTWFLSVSYSNKLSQEFNANYTIHPMIYDGTLGKIKLINHHSYNFNVLINLINKNVRKNNFNIWRM